MNGARVSMPDKRVGDDLAHVLSDLRDKVPVMFRCNEGAEPVEEGE